MTAAAAWILLALTALAVGSVVGGSLIVVLRLVRAHERAAEALGRAAERAVELAAEAAERAGRGAAKTTLLDLPARDAPRRRRVGFDPEGPTRSTERPRA